MRHAEKAAGKPGPVVNIEVYKASHGARIYPRIPCKATVMRRKGRSPYQPVPRVSAQGWRGGNGSIEISGLRCYL